LQTCEAKAVGKVITNRKELPKEETFSKTEKGPTYLTAMLSPSHHKVERYSGCYVPSTVHENEMVEAPLSKGDHQKRKLMAVIDYNKYKIGVDKSDKILAYYSFQRKFMKWWKKVFFHLFNFIYGDAYILHSKVKKRKVPCSFSVRKLQKECSVMLEQIFQNNPGVDLQADL
jgi:hypothetical protein